MLLKEGERLRLEIKPGLDPMMFHPLGGGRPHAMELLDGAGFDETRAVLRCDDSLSIRLVQVARHLGQEFVVGNAGRRIEAGDRLDLRADLQRNLWRSPCLSDPP